MPQQRKEKKKENECEVEESVCVWKGICTLVKTIASIELEDIKENEIGMKFWISVAAFDERQFKVFRLETISGFNKEKE